MNTNTTIKDSAVDNIAIQAGKIAYSLLDDIPPFETAGEMNIFEHSKRVLVKVIYDYEIRVCENCLHKDSIGVCRNYKSMAFGMDTTKHERFGCNKFMRVQS